jgi:hypothetical protein
MISTVKMLSRREWGEEVVVIARSTFLSPSLAVEVPLEVCASIYLHYVYIVVIRA